MIIFNKEEVLKKYKSKKIGVLYGGWSSERQISIQTGTAILESLKTMGLEAKGYDINKGFLKNISHKDIDVAYIALHGEGGEDGCIQSILEFLDIPYTGSNVLSSSLCMNKYYSKLLFESGKIPTPKFQYFKLKELGEESSIENLSKDILYPVIVKAVSQGSAIGVHLVKNFQDLKKAILDIKKYDSSILIENYIEGLELTVGILGDDTLPVIEIVPDNEFYDFESKYAKGKSKHIIPARIDKDIEIEIKKLAKSAHDMLGCKAVSRVDIILDKKNNPWVLEINTIPGMTETSLLPDAAKSIGIDFDELVLRILDYSVSK
jgi:D-alanine-D-alanine ligase